MSRPPPGRGGGKPAAGKVGPPPRHDGAARQSEPERGRGERAERAGARGREKEAGGKDALKGAPARGERPVKHGQGVGPKGPGGRAVKADAGAKVGQGIGPNGGAAAEWKPFTAQDPVSPRRERARQDPESRAPGAVKKAGAPHQDSLPLVRGDRLEGRNVVEEALLRKRRRVKHIWLDATARLDEKLSGVLAMAAAANVPVDTVDRARLDRMSLTGVHNGIIAEAEGLPQPSVKEAIEAAGNNGFFVLVDEVQYEHNLGAILRSALGAGVTAVIIPTERGKGLTPVVARVSMGGAEAVPVIREGLSSALAQLQRAGVRILAADMDGVPAWELDMSGPIALVLGGEDKGVSDALKKRADAIVGIPLLGNLQSLNVSVTAAVLMFERVRQRRALE